MVFKNIEELDRQGVQILSPREIELLRKRFRDVHTKFTQYQKPAGDSKCCSVVRFAAKTALKAERKMQISLRYTMESRFLEHWNCQTSNQKSFPMGILLCNFTPNFSYSRFLEPIFVPLEAREIGITLY